MEDKFITLCRMANKFNINVLRQIEDRKTEKNLITLFPDCNFTSEPGHVSTYVEIGDFYHYSSIDKPRIILGDDLKGFDRLFSLVHELGHHMCREGLNSHGWLSIFKCETDAWVAGLNLLDENIRHNPEGWNHAVTCLKSYWEGGLPFDIDSFLRERVKMNLYFSVEKPIWPERKED